MRIWNLTRVLTFSLLALSRAWADGQLAFLTPGADERILARSEYEVRWNPGSWTGEGTLSLLAGLISIDIASGEYSWAVGDPLDASNVYALVLELNAKPDTGQYTNSNLFRILAASEGTSAPPTANDGSASQSGTGVSTILPTETTSPSNSTSNSLDSSTDSDEGSSDDIRKIGAGVAAAALVVIIVSLIFAVRYYKRKASAPSAPSSKRNVTRSDSDVEDGIVLANVGTNTYEKAELDATTKEMGPVTHHVYELDSTAREPQELDASTIWGSTSRVDLSDKDSVYSARRGSIESSWAYRQKQVVE